MSFTSGISNKLNLDDLTTIIIFKGIDHHKKGKIKIEDFVLTIDSYRDDFLEQKEWRRKFYSDLRTFKRILENDFISVGIFYEKLGMEGFAFYSELLRCIKQELSTYEDFDEEIVKYLLNSLKQSDTKVYRADFENFVEKIQSSGNSIKANIDSKTNNYTIKLNNSQIYWINKLIVTLDSINVTPEMAFETSLEKNVDNKINLDNYKRIMRLIIPSGRLNSL
jgi:hypothetical protein